MATLHCFRAERASSGIRLIRGTRACVTDRFDRDRTGAESPVLINTRDITQDFQIPFCTETYIRTRTVIDKYKPFTVVCLVVPKRRVFPWRFVAT